MRWNGNRTQFSKQWLILEFQPASENILKAAQGINVWCFRMKCAWLNNGKPWCRIQMSGHRRRFCSRDCDACHISLPWYFKLVRAVCQVDYRLGLRRNVSIRPCKRYWNMDVKHSRCKLLHMKETGRSF